MNLKKYPTSESSGIKVGVTIGDPSGIGPVITLKAITKLKGLAKFTVIGDRWVLNRIWHIASCISNVEFIDLSNVRRKSFSFGQIKAEYGKASIEYLKKSLELIENKNIDCLVTSPISKEAIRLAGFGFPGHTEYLSHLTNTKKFAMMLLNKDLRISLVSRHIPLKDVPTYITKKRLYDTILLTYKSLKKLFKINNPRIVVCGINPHASDNGLIGEEENKIIKPALKKLKNKFKARIDGPLPSDVAIYKAKQKEYDCVIAMYHDQALIPLKLYEKDKGVNITLGLPFIRTSPLHGTAFDIAKKYHLANPNSLIEAIRLAIRCTQNLKRG